MALKYKKIMLEECDSELYLAVEVARNPLEEKEYLDVLYNLMADVETMLLSKVDDEASLSVCIGGEEELEIRYDGFTFDQKGVHILQDWYKQLQEYFEEEDKIYVVIWKDSCYWSGQEDSSLCDIDFVSLEDFLREISVD